MSGYETQLNQTPNLSETEGEELSLTPADIIYLFEKQTDVIKTLNNSINDVAAQFLVLSEKYNELVKKYNGLNKSMSQFSITLGKKLDRSDTTRFATKADLDDLTSEISNMFDEMMDNLNVDVIPAVDDDYIKRLGVK